MRNGLAAIICSLGLAFGVTGCPGDGSGDSGARSEVIAPIEGEWEVVNKDGKKTGQTVTIAADRIVMKNPRLSDSEGPATFSEKGDTIAADWLGAEFTFEQESPKKVVMKGGGQTYTLVRE